MFGIRKILIGVAVTIISLTGTFLNSLPDGRLHVYFLDVGQGDAIFVRTPDGINILVDGGSGKKILSELKSVVPFFDSTIDYVFSTHPDKDHIEGLIYVIEKYKVNRVLFAGGYKSNYLSTGFFKTAISNNIITEAAVDENDIGLKDGVLLDIIFPFEQNFTELETTNDNSLVLNIIYGENEILLTGDADETLEEKLLRAQSRIDADVLKVGHHGSKTSSSANFLRAVSPSWSVIQVGKDNKYGHPHSAALKRLENTGSKVFRTDLNGRIEFIFSEKKIIKINAEYPPPILAISRQIFHNRGQYSEYL